MKLWQVMSAGAFLLTRWRGGTMPQAVMPLQNLRHWPLWPLMYSRHQVSIHVGSELSFGLIRVAVATAVEVERVWSGGQAAPGQESLM